VNLSVMQLPFLLAVYVLYYEVSGGSDLEDEFDTKHFLKA